MGFVDILLHIDGYPETASLEAVEPAIGFARLVDGKLTGLALSVDFPVATNRLAEVLLNLRQLEQEAEAKSLAACRERLAQFTSAAEAAGVFAGAEVEKCPLYAMAQVVGRRARTRDLCLVPVTGPLDGQAEVAATAVFESGRPVLVYKPAETAFRSLDKVVVAWDGSRSAARALADARPLLAQAREVRLVSIVREKPGVQPGATAEALRHLQAHGVPAFAEEVEGRGRAIGESLGAYLETQPADLLVMGAYGHSRLREFILGGATEYVLNDPRVPVLLSH